MNKTYDNIVIGGGHNGLTNATYLANRGKKVLLVEKREILGGIAAGEEFHKGYRSCGLLHDTSLVSKQVISDLQLSKYGLKMISGRPTTAILSGDGRGFFLHSDDQKTSNEIRNHSEQDAASYIKFREFINRIKPFLSSLRNEIPPDLDNMGPSQLFALGKKGLGLKKLGKSTMMELLKVAPMCSADFLNEYFETEFIKAGLAAPSIYGSLNGPWASYTNYNLLSYESNCGDYVNGGPSMLIHALESAAKNAGVEILTGVGVDKILLDKSNSVTGILMGNEEINATTVSASCTPQETFLNLLEPFEISYSLDQDVHNYRARGTTAKVNIAVDQEVIFNFNTSEKVEFARIAESFEKMEKASDAVKYGEMSDTPILDISIPTSSDPSLAPLGHSVVSILVHFAPYDLKSGWTEKSKENLYRKVLAILEKNTNINSSSVQSQETLSPLDLEKRYGLTNGHIFHGEHALDQLITRPIPSCARYKTPLSGLYLCGSGSHPGGGITCIPGALAAKMIMKN